MSLSCNDYVRGLSLDCRAARAARKDAGGGRSKSFLVLFFKKELLASLMLRSGCADDEAIQGVGDFDLARQAGGGFAVDDEFQHVGFGGVGGL
jgi:hypothetical protein